VAKKLDLENERKYLLSLIRKGGGNAEWAKAQAQQYAQQYPGFSLDKSYSTAPAGGTTPGSSTISRQELYDNVTSTGNAAVNEARRRMLDNMYSSTQSSSSGSRQSSSSGSSYGTTRTTPGYNYGSPDEVRIRDYILNYGKQYGITNKDIGWDGSNVLLGGQRLVTPSRIDDSGRSWGDINVIKKAIDNYANRNKMQPNMYEDIINKGAQDYFYGGQDSIPQWNGGQDSIPQWKEPAPYVSPYSDKINALLKKLETYPEFDSSTIYESPEYLALQERIRQIADKTRRNTMADAAAMTGGMPSSYALAAAASAEGDIKGKLLDTVPALTESAYGRYMDKQLAEFNLLQKLEELDKEAYGRHYGERAWDRSIYESDWGHDYQTRQDLLDRLRSLESEKYQRAIDERDYDRGTYESDRAFNYQVERDGKTFDYQVTRDKILDNRWMKQFDYNEAQDILANALRERQITVAERNATLAQNKFEWEKDPTNPENMADPETIGALYASMFASENPEEWLKENAQYLSKDELKTLVGFLPSNSEAVQMMKILFPDGI
jgi:hypothetical protein